MIFCQMSSGDRINLKNTVNSTTVQPKLTPSPSKPSILSINFAMKCVGFETFSTFVDVSALQATSIRQHSKISAAKR